MGLFEHVNRYFTPIADSSNQIPAAFVKKRGENAIATATPIAGEAAVESGLTGVRLVEAAQSLWGKKGMALIIAGLAIVMILFELDNSTVYAYNNYSTSEFRTLSALATLSTANTIVFAVAKPPVAKVSDIIGRGWTLAMTISFYVVAYILMASATSLGQYAPAFVFYSIGQSGTNVMINIIIADITTPRWRGFALGVSYFPFLITPWVAALLVNSVVGGIGWRWGIGMFAILMPFGSSFIVGTLVFYQRKASKMGLVPAKKMTVYSFCSDIDLGGILLFVAGLSMLLLPITMAAKQPGGWKTPCVLVSIVVGFLLTAVALPVYDNTVARNPFVPVSYVKNATIVLSILVVATDMIGFSVTHTYLYAWATVARNMSARDAVFYTYTNGVVQCLVAIFAGWVMLVTRRYKWLAFSAVIVRLIGYGLMLRLRGQSNSYGDLFAQQIIQGLGSGIVQTSLLVPPQTVVPHAQVAQVLALVFSSAYLGSSIGAAMAGGIYTNTFRPALWKYLGTNGTEALVDQLFDSITGTLPGWDSPDRKAINCAYTHVMTNMTYAAFGASVPALLLCWFLPDLTLPNDKSFFVGHDGGLKGQNQERSEGQDLLQHSEDEKQETNVAQHA